MSNIAPSRKRIGKGQRTGDAEATEASRDLVETVAVFRDPARPGGVGVEIAGRFNALIGDEAHPNQVKGVWTKVVVVERIAPRPERSGSGSAASDTLRPRADQIVRSARSNILFYDEHVIDLSHRIRAM